MRAVVMAAVAAVALLWRPAAAAEVRVLTAGAFKPVLLALAPAFERESGHRLAVENDTAGGVARRIAAGEAFDLVVLPQGALADLAAAGRVAGAPVPLARVGVGVAVREGAPRPDIAGVEAFRQALLAARTVAYIDPAAGGTSGIYLEGLFVRLGIAEAVRAKAVRVPGGLVGERVARGEAELGLQQISELQAVPGIVLLGPLPEEVQAYTTYSGAVVAAGAQKAAAEALLAALTGGEARRVLVEKGMEPPR